MRRAALLPVLLLEQHLATAAADVSDGLAADLNHIAKASGVGIVLNLSVLPLSAAAQAWFEDRVDPQAALEDLATGGDDYQIVFTAHPRHEETLRREAERRLLRLTRIGRVTAGQGVVARFGGQAVAFDRTGFSHG